MSTPIRMPKLGMTMTEGKVVAWPFALGDRVEKGQTVVVIESEKTEAEIEATAAGFFRHVYVEVDDTVPCGALLGALTDTADEPFDAQAFRAENDLAEAEEGAGEAAPHREAAAPSRSRGERIAIAPAARALARELGVDPALVPGTGPGGRITKRDVEKFTAEDRPQRNTVAASGGVRLEVPSEGEGEPPVLLLPGFGTDASSWSFQIPELVPQHRVLAVNPRGVGASDAPRADLYSVADAAEDAAAIAAGPAHVVGASLGAAVAIELALRHPDRVASLVLVTPFVEASGRLGALLDAWCRIGREGSPETLARALLPWFFSEGFLADEAGRERTLRGLAASVARVPAATLERTAAGLLAWSGTRRDALGEIRAETLVVTGGADLLSPGGEEIARAIPKARHVGAPDAGHAVAIEAPKLVSESIAAHLARASGDGVRGNRDPGAE